ncbi:MAG: threonine ammonia-lyase [Planctomycetota bacterium]|nr:threonine ammonia-lyase [Planctomycetota bacterium]
MYDPVVDRISFDDGLPSTLAHLRAAAERIAPFIRRTPTIYSQTFSESSGLEVFLKLENLQRTGSFKARGALNKVLSLPKEMLTRGLVAASAGNHAQGVALAAKIAGAHAVIVMPRSTPIIKVQRTESYGAEVVLHGDNYDASQAHAVGIAKESGATLVHPFDDPWIVCGQGTCGLEIVDELEDIDAVVVPIGGGGLISGVALAIKALSPRTRVIGVQAVGAAPMVHSFLAGKRQHVDSPMTIADGIRVGVVGDITFEVVRRYVDECVTVEEDEIVDAVLQAMEKSKIVAETGGVPGIAAILAGKVKNAKRVLTIVSGGNIDLNLIARIVENGLERAGRTHNVRLRTTDTPGQLVDILGVIAANQCNVLDIQHYRAGFKVPLGMVDIDILLETRKAGAGLLVDEALRARGYDLRSS